METRFYIKVLFGDSEKNYIFKTENDKNQFVETISKITNGEAEIFVREEMRI